MDTPKTADEVLAFFISKLPPDRFPSFNSRAVGFVRKLLEQGYTQLEASKTALALCFGAAWALEDVEAQAVKGAK